jgi:hypothetical protein
MAMQRPIVTSALNFARAVCNDCAIYFSPEGVEDAADAIEKLIDDDRLWHASLEKGRDILARLPTQRQKYAHYLDIIETMANPGVRSMLSSRKLPGKAP